MWERKNLCLHLLWVLWTNRTLTVKECISSFWGRSCFIALSGLELTTLLLPQPPGCWHNSHAPPCPFTCPGDWRFSNVSIILTIKDLRLRQSPLALSLSKGAIFPTVLTWLITLLLSAEVDEATTNYTHGRMGNTIHCTRDSEDKGLYGHQYRTLEVTWNATSKVYFVLTGKVPS